MGTATDIIQVIIRGTTAAVMIAAGSGTIMGTIITTVVRAMGMVAAIMAKRGPVTTTHNAGPATIPAPPTAIRIMAVSLTVTMLRATAWTVGVTTWMPTEITLAGAMAAIRTPAGPRAAAPAEVPPPSVRQHRIPLLPLHRPRAQIAATITTAATMAATAVEAVQAAAAAPESKTAPPGVRPFFPFPARFWQAASSSWTHPARNE